MFVAASTRKPSRVRIQKHIEVLLWKNYLQRKRRWRIFLLEILFATLMFITAGFKSRNVFLTPLRSGNSTALEFDDIRSYLGDMVYVGYAPSDPQIDEVMVRFSQILGLPIIRKGNSEEELNDALFTAFKGKGLSVQVIWILWKTTGNNAWRVKIRSSARAKLLLNPVEDVEEQSNQFLESGFLAVEMALCQAIVEYNQTKTNFAVRLKSMPISPLMQEERVKNCVAWILLCFTLALMPPVIETEALVVTETARGFKRALRLRDVDFSSIYAGWVLYAHMSALPVCLMGGVFLIFVFRWIHLAAGMAFVLAYQTVMIMLALLMALFHKHALPSCIWSLLLVLLQTFMAELLVHHTDIKEGARSIMLHVVVPPLGLVNGLSHFALLQVGKEGWTSSSLNTTIVTWLFISVVYFGLLMLLQRTMGQQRAIGGQVSWKSIIFKKPDNSTKPHPVEMPTGKERDQLQEVDEFVAKAISFHTVSKRVMGRVVLKDVTFDIYRGEYTILYAKTVQNELITTLENIITGLAPPDEGTVTTLGYPNTAQGYLAVPHMLGYCHNSLVLLDDLTVGEHLQFFMQICTWHESPQYVLEYEHIRSNRLLEECELFDLKDTKVEKLTMYFKAQLCWAIALLLEPRVVFLPGFIDKPSYVAVITDKIVRYRNHLTIVQTCDSSMKLENADRVFIFNNNSLVFGGTMPYLFFKYGRDYRLRLVFKGDSGDQVVNIKALKDALGPYGAVVRAHFGSLLILRVPVRPTANVVSIVKFLNQNSNRYGFTSVHLTIPDSEEVCTRAMMGMETKADTLTHNDEAPGVKQALEKIKNQMTMKRARKNYYTNVRWIGKKFTSFHIYYRFFFILTVIACLVAGIFIGRELGVGVAEMNAALQTVREPQSIKDLLLTAEALDRKTTFALRSDNATESLSLTHAYTFSIKNETSNQLSYIALRSSDSLMEYLRIGATLEPQECVIKYAYGMDVFFKDGIIHIYALYSPLHVDKAASARSLGRVYESLLRHYTGALDALIEIEDQPLLLDVTPVKITEEFPQLLIPSLVLLTVSHVTLLPSHEYGFIRHTQKYARNFSPFQYWTTLWVWDMATYALLVIIMMLGFIPMILLISPWYFHEYIDLIIVPTLMIVYGFGSIPQAYLFSLSSHASLNTITYIIVNIVFGESTVMTRMFSGYTLDVMMVLLNFSPQFNFAFALVKITRIFIYNTECLIVQQEKYCDTRIIHKCCDKCGLVEPCYLRKNYLSFHEGILHEMILIVTTAGIFFCLLMLWEYKYIKRWLVHLSSRWLYPGDVEFIKEDNNGAAQEKNDVLEKTAQLKNNNAQLVNTFGECLLVNDLSDKAFGRFVLNNVYLGLRKGEALAVSGLIQHGRIAICDVLSGFKLASGGDSLAMSKWSLRTRPHLYSRKVSMCCERPPLPQWMTVKIALQLIAVLRGVPANQVKEEVWNYIEALELSHKADAVIYTLPLSETRRLHFAAAVVGAPPVIILDECTAYQPTSVHRAMYLIIHHMRRQGHALLIASARVESHLPVTGRLAIMMNGHIFDMGHVDSLIETYSQKGYTVAVHLKDEVDAAKLFRGYFTNYVVNDATEVLVNVQVLDKITLLVLLTKMEELVSLNSEVYTYVVSTVPIDYIYNTILSNEAWNIESTENLPCCWKQMLAKGKQKQPSVIPVEHLKEFPKKYSITKLADLPWSVVFQR